VCADDMLAGLGHLLVTKLFNIGLVPLELQEEKSGGEMVERVKQSPMAHTSPRRRDVIVVSMSSRGNVLYSFSLSLTTLISLANDLGRAM